MCLKRKLKPINNVIIRVVSIPCHKCGFSIDGEKLLVKSKKGYIDSYICPFCKQILLWGKDANDNFRT